MRVTAEAAFAEIIKNPVTLRAQKDYKLFLNFMRSVSTVRADMHEKYPFTGGAQMQENECLRPCSPYVMPSLKPM
jgi:hypothetical protein